MKRLSRKIHRTSRSIVGAAPYVRRNNCSTFGLAFGWDISTQAPSSRLPRMAQPPPYSGKLRDNNTTLPLAFQTTRDRHGPSGRGMEGRGGPSELHRAAAKLDCACT
jgi:hypothetical protein